MIVDRAKIEVIIALARQEAGHDDGAVIWGLATLVALFGANVSAGHMHERIYRLKPQRLTA